MENSSSPRNHSRDLAAIIFSVTEVQHHTPPVLSSHLPGGPKQIILEVFSFLRALFLNAYEEGKTGKREGLPTAVFSFFCKKKRNDSKCIPHFTFALKFNFKDMISNKLKFASKWFLGLNIFWAKDEKSNPTI